MQNVIVGVEQHGRSIEDSFLLLDLALTCAHAPTRDKVRHVSI